MQLSDSLYLQAGSTWKIALQRLFELIYTVLTKEFALNPDTVKQALASDYARAKLKGIPSYEQNTAISKNKKQGIANKRQLKHN